MPTEPTDWEKRVEDVLPCIHETRICREEVLAILSEFAEEAVERLKARRDILIFQGVGRGAESISVIELCMAEVRSLLPPKKEG